MLDIYLYPNGSMTLMFSIFLFIKKHMRLVDGRGWITIAVRFGAIFNFHSTRINVVVHMEINYKEKKNGYNRRQSYSRWNDKVFNYH